MKHRNRITSWVLSAAAGLALASALAVSAQTGVPAAKNTAQAHRQAQTAPVPQLTDQNAAATQDQLLKLLRVSPVLTSVVARDPSLLADQEYVARNNPELAQFIASHPDIAKNPEFYLFSRLNSGNGKHRDQALERAVWPDLVPVNKEESTAPAVIGVMIPILVPLGFFAALGWIIYVFVQNHHRNRVLKQQTELHSRLIEKLGTSQELAAYMETEAGKRFLMASSALMESEPGSRIPNAVARVLTPLQVGIVMTLLGIGLLLLRHAGPGLETAMTVLGVLALMPGLGFILSAGVTWVLARRMGLMPAKGDAETGASASFGPPDRQ
jgi:hypothetical protein